MESRHPIKVDGVILQEYLRDNESIEDEIKSKQFIRDGFEKINLNRHVKEKYADRREKNGKVKILGQIEINKANAGKYLKEALKVRNYRKAFVVILMTTERKGFLVLNQIADEIAAFADASNINYKDSYMRHAMRGALGYLKKSHFFEHIVFHDRNTEYNPQNVSILKVKESSKDIPLEKAIALSLKIRDDVKIVYGKKTKKKKSAQKQTQNKYIEIPFPKTETDPPQPQPEIPKLPASIETVLSEAIERLTRLKSDNGALINFQGDLVININLGQKS